MCGEIAEATVKFNKLHDFFMAVFLQRCLQKFGICQLQIYKFVWSFSHHEFCKRLQHNTRSTSSLPSSHQWAVINLVDGGQEFPWQIEKMWGLWLKNSCDEKAGNGANVFQCVVQTIVGQVSGKLFQASCTLGPSWFCPPTSDFCQLFQLDLCLYATVQSQAWIRRNSLMHPSLNFTALTPLTTWEHLRKLWCGRSWWNDLDQTKQTKHWSCSSSQLYAQVLWQSIYTMCYMINLCVYIYIIRTCTCIYGVIVHRNQEDVYSLWPIWSWKLFPTLLDP